MKVIAADANDGQDKLQDQNRATYGRTQQIDGNHRTNLLPTFG
jgi:hypothetical protein